MAETVIQERDGGLATLRLNREHGNAINPRLAKDLRAACEEAAADDGVRGAMLAASGKLFCPGLDLQELTELDREEMERFVSDFGAAVHALYAFPKPLLCAMHSHAVAGGCVLSLTTDWRVLCEDALVGLAEVRVGVPLPYGVAQILRDSVPPQRLEEIALFGRNYRGEEALAVGLVDELHPRKGFEDHCRLRLEELASKDPGAFEITKRYLRHATLERIRANEPKLRHEFLDAWFSPQTRERVRAIVEELKSGRS